MSEGAVRKTVIEPGRGWRMLDVREFWAYRDLLGMLVLRDIRLRYKQTLLGVAWVVLRPLLSMVVFTLVFGKLAKIPSDGYPYALFVFSGLIPWTFFAGATGAAGSSLVGSAGLIGKVYFPRLIIPVASVGSGLVDMAVSTVFLLAMMPFFGAWWSINLAALPFLVLALLALALGFGTLFSALNVAYRDFGGVMAFGLQIWMYATPVVYPASLIPPGLRWVLHFNPMAALVDGFRSALLGKPFDWAALGVAGTAAVAAFAVGIAYFEKVERGFADII